MSNEIKLLNIGKTENGSIRLQSQLYVGKSTADFVKRKDEDFVRCYGHGKNGMDFYPYDKPYRIVDNILEMQSQRL